MPMFGGVSQAAITAALAVAHPQISTFVATPSAVVSSFDQTSALTARPMLPFATPLGTAATSLLVNKNELLQPYFGMGATITDASAYILMKEMSAAQRAALLTRVFGTDGMNMVRIAIGPVDYSAAAYATYDDAANDTTLSSFSVQADGNYIIPVLQQILSINPKVKIVASPWSPPGWLKTTGGAISGGTLTFNSTSFTTYANYFVKFIQAYHAYGIPIWAVTPQNEPDVNTNYPSVAFSTSDINTFIKSHLRPALDAAGLKPKILAGDTQWNLTYGSAALADSATLAAIDGIAYHWYSGTPLSQLSDLRPYPSKICGVTEYFSGGGVSSSQIGGGVNPYKVCANLLNCDAIRYGGSFAIYFNLVLQRDGYPAHGFLSATAAGDTAAANNATNPSSYQGFFDIDPANGTIYRTNPAYIVAAHISRFAKPGARVCANDLVGLGADAGLKATTFVNVDGSVVAFIYNGTSAAQTIAVTDTDLNLSSAITLNPFDMATIAWSSAPIAIAGTGTLTAPTAATGLGSTSAAGTAALSWTAPTQAGSGGTGGYFISPRHFGWHRNPHGNHACRGHKLYRQHSGGWHNLLLHRDAVQSGRPWPGKQRDERADQRCAAVKCDARYFECSDIQHPGVWRDGKWSSRDLVRYLSRFRQRQRNFAYQRDDRLDIHLWHGPKHVHGLGTDKRDGLLLLRRRKDQQPDGAGCRANGPSRRYSSTLPQVCLGCLQPGLPRPAKRDHRHHYKCPRRDGTSPR